MHLTHRTTHLMILALALLLGLVAWAMPKPAGAQTGGYYTTSSETTSITQTDPATGTTTTINRSERTVPRAAYTTRTGDLDARYPYDNTGGRNRSDVDAVRSGFDDPRNPWDGRYMNDNPRNSAQGAGSNATVNRMRGNEAYRPGRYGTYSATRGRN